MAKNRNRRRSGSDSGASGGGESSSNSKSNLKNKINEQLNFNPENIKNIHDDLSKIEESINSIHDYLGMEDGMIRNANLPEAHEQMDVLVSLNRLQDKLNDLAVASEGLNNDVSKLISENNPDIPEPLQRHRWYMDNIMVDITASKDYLNRYYPNTYASYGFHDEYI